MSNRLSFDAAIGFDAAQRDHPKWQEVTGYVRGFTTRRGRSFELDNVEAGTAQITLDNTDGRFSPVTLVSAPIFPYAYSSGVTPGYGVGSTLYAPNQLTAGPHTTLSNPGNNTYFLATLGAGNNQGDFIAGFKTIPVNPGERLVHYMTIVTSAASSTVGCTWSMYDSGMQLVANIRDNNSISLSNPTALPCSTELVVPPGVAFVKVWIDYRDTATFNLTVSNVYMYRWTSYADYLPTSIASQGGVMQPSSMAAVSQVAPNRRIRLTSIMGQNLWPMWLASPQAGQSATYAWDTSTVGIPGKWWTYDFFANANQPAIPNIGTTSLRFRYWATSDTQYLSGTSIRTDYGIYQGRQYKISFWIRADLTQPAVPPPGVISLSIIDQTNGNNGYYFNSPAWTISNWNTTPGGWMQFSGTFTVPTGFISPAVCLSFSFGGAIPCNNLTSNFAYEIMGLQLQPMGSAGNTQPSYVYGDGAEPIFVGFTDKWTAINASPFGLFNEAVVDCADDMRLCADTQFPTPCQALMMRNNNCVAYLPLNDTSTQSTSEIAGGMTTSPTFYQTPSSSMSVTVASTPLIGAQGIEGNAYSWNSPATTLLDISCPMLNGNIPYGCFTNNSTSGWGASFYFNIPPTSRPADGTYYIAFGQSSDGAGSWGGLVVGLYGDANGDYVKATWGATTWQAQLAYPRGGLFDGKAHFVQIGADPNNPLTGVRRLGMSVDIGVIAYKQTYWTPTVAGTIMPKYSYIGGMKDASGNVINGFVGQVGHVAFYNSNTPDPSNDPGTNTDSIGRWLLSTLPMNGLLGTAALNYMLSWVNPSYSQYITRDSGYVVQPISFQNANGLALIQDMAKDLESVFFFSRYGQPAWRVKSQMDSIWSGIPANADIQSVSWQTGTGPDPGYSFESDIANIYTMVKGSQNGSSNTVYAATQADMRLQYGYREYSFTSNLRYGFDIQARTQTLLSRYSSPKVRISDTHWSLASNDQLASIILRLDLMSMLSISGFPADAPWPSASFSVQRIDHTVTVNGYYCDWDTVLSLQKVG